MEDHNETINLPAVTGEPSTQLSTSSTAIERDRRREFAKTVSPLLTLTAPTGMTQGERKAWMHAAYLALSRFAPKLVARGAEEAMTKVDHPAKIVAAITAEINALPDFVRRYLSKEEPHDSAEDLSPVNAVVSGLADRLRGVH